MQTQRISPFLTFNGNAQEAMRYYAEHLPGATITRLVRYGTDGAYGGEGEETVYYTGRCP